MHKILGLVFLILGLSIFHINMLVDVNKHYPAIDFIVANKNMLGSACLVISAYAYYTLTNKSRLMAPRKMDLPSYSDVSSF